MSNSHKISANLFFSERTKKGYKGHQETEQKRL